MKMKKTGKFLSFLLAIVALMILTTSTALAAAKKPTQIKRVGAASRTVTLGQEFELKVKMTPANANDNALRWEITSGKGVIVFDDADKQDDDIDFRAKKTGTAKVRCYINGKKKNSKTSVTFTVKVTQPQTQKQIARYGNAAVTKNVGDEFELKVRKSKGLSDKELDWSIEDDTIVTFFNDYELHDDEIDFLALKAGTTKVTCKIKNASGSNTSITFTVTVKKTAGTIASRGALTKTVRVGDDFDLEVRKTGVRDNQLKWEIADHKIVSFDDYDIYDDEVEFRARKVGTTTVTCSINGASGANAKVTYTIHVVSGGYGDYDDDDYYDDFDDYYWDD